MFGLDTIFVLILGAFVIVTTALQMYFFERRFRATRISLEQEISNRQSDQIQLQKVSESLSIRNFEFEWLQATARHPHPVTAAAEVVFQWIEQKPNGFVGVIDRDFHVVSVSSLENASVLELSPSGQEALRSSQTSVLSASCFRSSGEVFSGTEHLYAFQCGQFANTWLVCSEIPRISSDVEQDTKLLSQYCLQLEFEGGEPQPVPHANVLDFDQDEFRLVRDMLQLRTLADTVFNSPQQMLEEFLSNLAIMSGFDRASIYSRSETIPDQLAVYAVGGVSSTSTSHQNTAEVERAILKRFRFTQKIVWLEGEQLKNLCPNDVLNEVKSSLIVPCHSAAVPSGILVLTGTQKLAAAGATEELVTWASEFLLSSFQKASNQHDVEERARRDGLTKLANRATFDEELTKILAACQSTQACCSLLLIDLDHFKSVNDTHGHLAGDEVLRQVSRLLLRTMSNQRVNDRPLIARYGGEEFAMIIPDCNLYGATRIAEALQGEVQNALIQFENTTIRVTASIGVASTADSGYGSISLIRGADDALYLAKADGRNRVCTTYDLRCGSEMHQPVLYQ